MNIIPTEYEEACCFAEWLEIKGFWFSHLAQETFTRSWGTKMKNKRMGVKKGVPDFLILKGDKILFVELKRKEKGVVSKEQKEWIDALNYRSGVKASVCYGADEAIQFIENN